MKTFLTTLILLGFSTTTFAQALHGHPQKAAYLSPAEWPTDSAQCHWKPANNVIPPTSIIEQALKDGTFVPLLAHTHIDMKFPRYAEFGGGTLTIPFVAKLFHTPGHIVDFFAGYDATDHRPIEIVWDTTGTSELPVMEGDPHGLRQWTGHFVIDPDPAVLHGWMDVYATVKTHFDNGDETRITLYEPLFSTLDPSAPLRRGQEGQMIFASRCTPGSPRRPDVTFGSNQIDIVNQYLPVAPISVPWPFGFSAIGYGAGVLPLATFEYRSDLDLHNNISGRSLQEIRSIEDIFPRVVLDPAVLGNGPHKTALMFQQPDGGMEEVTTLLVIDLTVDPNAPPITNPNPPVVPPPPPPPPPPPAPLPSTLLPPLTVTVCDASAPPKCSTVVVRP